MGAALWVFMLAAYIMILQPTYAMYDSLTVENLCEDVKNQFQCREGSCIPVKNRCDGITQCSDASDELDCEAYLCKAPKWFKCKRIDLCISSSYVCDGDNDCEDMSDEKDCHNFKAAPGSHSANCTSAEWKCQDSLCIPKELVCNGNFDCLDHSDELVGCTANHECDYDFKCDNNHCIPHEWVCDGNDDCLDNSDEKNCMSHVRPEECILESNRFLCNDSLTCINSKNVCDKTNNCPDGSDEGPNCYDLKHNCETLNCTHSCMVTPSGPKCICRPGFKHTKAGKCVDIDECNEMYGSCTQFCKNTIGSFECSCDDMYELQSDNKTCKVIGGEPLLVFSTHKEIRGIRLNTGLYYEIVGGLKQVVGVAFNGKHVYWTEMHSEHESILRALEDGSGREIIVTSGLSAPEDLAVDWLTGNIYFTDAGMQHIGVCSNDGAHCTVLINKDVHKPRAIVLHPEKGQMYWSDWGNRPEIARSYMDGSNDITFVGNEVRWPNGLAIDYPNNRLYWIDAKLLTLESILLTGMDRRVVLKGIVKHPYAIAVFEDRLYWSDWQTRSIEMCDKFTGKHRKSLIREKDEIYGIHVYHSAMRKRTSSSHMCSYAPCSHLCLPKGDSWYSCACPQDETLNADRHSCKAAAKKHILMVATEGLLIKIQHKQLGKHDITALPIEFHKIRALAYDSIQERVIVFDSYLGKVMVVNKDDSSTETLFEVSGLIGGMDFDYYGNNLYWCDTIARTIEMYSFATKNRKVIHRVYSDDDIPVGIAVVPEQGVMFVSYRTSSTSQGNAHIDRLTMDGQNITHVIEHGLLGPSLNLVYDADLKLVFWADPETKNIETISIDGKDRHGFRSLQKGPYSLAILGDDLFWTNWNSRRIYWANKSNRGETHNKKITLNLPKDMSRLLLLSASEKHSDSSHACRTNNGNCSHICVPAENGSRMCVCPLPLALGPDGVTCAAVEHCTTTQVRCGTTAVCLDKHKWCDGKKDCPFGEDEADCVGKLCPYGERPCDNKHCIDESKWCDNNEDCTDKSDEMNCDQIRRPCFPNQFKCLTGECINGHRVCDTVRDCTDGSDENDCLFTQCQNSDFRCNNGRCIPSNWECDGDADCPDKSDEHSRCLVKDKACGAGLFRCSNDRCIDSVLVCNQEDDCQDNSDEENCKFPQSDADDDYADLSSTHLMCEEDEIPCKIKNNTMGCLPDAVMCNGTNECLDGEDEEDCSLCEDDHFMCNNTKCIPKVWLCDGADDCGDGTDEETGICSTKDRNRTHPEFVPHIHIPCNDGFRCNNGQCIDWMFVCDGRENCEDRTDEHGSCQSSCERTTNPCQVSCIKTPRGPKCVCKPGYSLKQDNRTCEDIDECDLSRPICSQICVNTLGSFKCDCFNGFELRNDRKSCKSFGKPMSIVFSVGNEVRKLTPANRHLEVIFNELSPKITDLDMSIKEDAVYFTIKSVGSIFRVRLTNKSIENVKDIGFPTRIAVDWTTDNVYFIDCLAQEHLKVCHLSNNKCAHLSTIETNAHVSTLLVDPLNKYIFYSASWWWAFHQYKSIIYRSEMDGSNTVSLVETKLGYISGMTLDINKRVVYFADETNKIERINYDGSQRSVIWHNKTSHIRPRNLYFFEDHLYFIIPGGRVVQCRLYGERRTCNEIRLHPYNIDFFTIFQQSVQPTNATQSTCNNKNCSHICLPLRTGPVCVCENGQKIKDDQQCGTDMNMGMDTHKPVFNTEVTSGVQSSSSVVLATLGSLFFIALIVSALVLVYKKRTVRSFSPGFSTHFQNPIFGITRGNDNIYTTRPPESGILKPGEHEYVNPLQNNPRREGEDKTFVVIDKNIKPIVLQDSDTDSEYDNKDKTFLVKS